MTSLGHNSWGKSQIRVSKIHRGQGAEDFTEVTVGVTLTGEVDGAYVDADNSGVLPTDTIRNTVYALAQDHLTPDMEGFASTLFAHFLGRAGVSSVAVELEQHCWERHTKSGFVGSSSERRIARIEGTADDRAVWGGIAGLMLLKTTDSAFRGFPRDEYTTLAETDDRILATTVRAEWLYDAVPADTTAIWKTIRSELCEGFFSGWSGSVQHQGWQMASAVMAAVPEIVEISFQLPNQHHLGFDLTRFGMDDTGLVFQPTSEPYGDIRFTATR